MASKARKAFDENCKDVERLLQLHSDEGGDRPGRRYGLEVLNKSAIVLITAYWEAYCEDLAEEGVEHLVAHLKNPKKLPNELKRQIARELEKNYHSLAVWEIAGDNWRPHLKSRLNDLKTDRNRRLNSPNTNNIKLLFKNALGIEDVSSNWYWAGMSVEKSCRKLDSFIELRGAVAHRGTAAESVKKNQVTNYLAHIKKLVTRTGAIVDKELKQVTEQKLYKTRIRTRKRSKKAN